jgi:Family of unknown function (DUF6228)
MPAIDIACQEWLNSAGRITRMAHSTIIKSARDGTTLEFFDRTANHYKVSLKGSQFHGDAPVYAFEPVSHLAGFFNDLAVHWRGWSGKKEWGSLEGELSLTATSDSTGHISLSVHLRPGPDPLDWRLSTVLLVEAGQLEQIAFQIERFMVGESGK